MIYAHKSPQPILEDRYCLTLHDRRLRFLICVSIVSLNLGSHINAKADFNPWSKKSPLFLTDTAFLSFYAALILPMHHHVDSSNRQLGRNAPPLEESLDPLPALPRVSCLQGVPTDTSSLNTYEFFVRILGRQVRHRLRFFDPWVPNHHIRQHIPREFESRLLLLQDDNLLRWVHVVDTIDLRRDSDGSRFFFPSTANFVCERDLFEPGDRDV